MNLLEAEMAFFNKNSTNGFLWISLLYIKEIIQSCKIEFRPFSSKNNLEYDFYITL